MYEIDSEVIFLVMVITFLGQTEGLLQNSQDEPGEGGGHPYRHCPGPAGQGPGHHRDCHKQKYLVPLPQGNDRFDR